MISYNEEGYNIINYTERMIYNFDDFVNLKFHFTYCLFCIHSNGNRHILTENLCVQLHVPCFRWQYER